jgi:hypothetical protein
MKSLEIFVSRWRSADLIAFPPYAESVVRATFLDAGIELARDLLALYGEVGGMDMSDDTDWRLWSLAEVEDRKLEANAFGVLFSDYMFDCWDYRIKPNDGDTSSVYVEYFDGGDPLLVAGSLEAFFDRLLEKGRGFLEDRPSPRID